MEALIRPPLSHRGLADDEDDDDDPPDVDGRCEWPKETNTGASRAIDLLHCIIASCMCVNYSRSPRRFITAPSPCVRSSIHRCRFPRAVPYLITPPPSGTHAYGSHSCVDIARLPFWHDSASAHRHRATVRALLHPHPLMAQAALDGAYNPTLTTSYIPPLQTPATTSISSAHGGIDWSVVDGDGQSPWWKQPGNYSMVGLGSTGKGILIGMLSAFGSAALVALVVAIVYFFRYTNRGRILLDRIGRPGEFDDEQQFLKEEEEALAEMDDLQRAEYHRAKGMHDVLGPIVEVHS